MARVKICGITNVKDALTAADLGADALGFVFYPKSPRCVHPEDAARIIASVPPFVSTVGVFVDPDVTVLSAVLSVCRLDYLQLHGSETPEYCRRVRDKFGKRVIKAFRVKDESSLISIADYDVDAYLLDTYVSGAPGGTGLTFRWEVTYNSEVDRSRLILAGGLHPDNVRTAVRTVKPWAVDVSSGVETEPGRKDREKIARFIAAAKGEE